MRLLVAGVLAALLAGCGAVPMPKDAPVGKVATTDVDTDRVSENYAEARDVAMTLLDVDTLALAESGPMLEIDSGAIEVARILSGGTAIGESDAVWRTQNVYTPRLDAYPLWYVTVAVDRGRDRRQVRVFSRASSTDGWRMVAGPEAVRSTRLPEPVEDDGVLRTLPLDADSGLVASPTDVLDDYAADLDDSTSTAPPADSFAEQMRAQEAALVAEHPGLVLDRAWGVEPEGYAIRTADGGALVIATLSREDAYSLTAGASVSWPADSEQRAHLGDTMTAPGTLRYLHQVLMYVPPGSDTALGTTAGSGTPRVLGQYGGVVGRVDEPAPTAPGPAAPAPTAPAPTAPAPAAPTAPAPAAPGPTALGQGLEPAPR